MCTRNKESLERIERCLKNASKFLWGLPRGNQAETYSWLSAKGLVFDRSSYTNVTNQLLEKYGIEKLVKELITPRVKELFTQKAIEFLKTCWLAGSRPDMSFLRMYNISDASPFLEINNQFNFVERWGEFAAVWFEEIEKL